MAAAFSALPLRRPANRPSRGCKVTLRVLLVEDDRGCATCATRWLSRATGAHRGQPVKAWPSSRMPVRQGARARASTSCYSTSGLPDGDGRRCWPLRRRTAPVLVISARQAEGHKIRLLDAGADDYLVKPFAIGELLARLRVALRHRGTTVRAALTQYRHAGVQVDLVARRVWRDGQPVHLTPTEQQLLARLVRSAGRW
jgi:two-component system KDP operon response regulator KdpE